ncbi:myeloid leukemia factor 1 isoform X8 [Sceloporus undulatus]|uniref:myeloid leukemia factor 1 isoform X8 n=1 Tax=Sceloporus undulatus TaxID=8520 RepID=UPI001C4B1A0F|nr:myeloid leukemia factor 1 isoform X8 [Sceloporus undulatus]
MFRGMSRVFEEDPFFRDPLAAHNEHIRQFVSEPFDRDPFFAGRERRLAQRGHPDCQNIDFRDPFSAVNMMMSNMGNHMMDLQANFDKMALNSNAHVFSSSSMMTFTKKGDEPPKIFQASAQTHVAPGGIKETRKALKDSETGLEKMAIGHHIQDRAHVIQKAKNNKTGDEELNQEFVNLDETEAHAFDEQWQKEIQKFKLSLGRNNIDAPRLRNIQHVGREDAVRREKTHPRPTIEGSRKPKSSLQNLTVKGSHVPLKASKN